MDAQTFIDAIIQGGAIAVLGVWVIAERKDNNQLWSIVESLVKLRLKQVEENQDTAFMELE
jgi:hypothetical protein